MFNRPTAFRIRPPLEPTLDKPMRDGVVELFVLVLGGGPFTFHWRANRRVQDRGFICGRLAEYEWNKFVRAWCRKMPLYVLVDSDVWSDYEFWCKVQPSVDADYPHVFSEDVFHLLSIIVNEVPEASIGVFSTPSEASVWLHKQWGAWLEEESSKEVVRSPEQVRRLKIFLCHASQDKLVTREVARCLRQAGAEPWLDEEQLLPGQEWEPQIKRALRLADVIVVCVSQTSVAKVGFVQKELRFALDIANEQPPGTIFVIPLMLDDSPLPDWLAKWQSVTVGRIGRLRDALNARANEAERRP